LDNRKGIRAASAVRACHLPFWTGDSGCTRGFPRAVNDRCACRRYRAAPRSWPGAVRSATHAARASGRAVAPSHSNQGCASRPACDRWTRQHLCGRVALACANRSAFHGLLAGPRGESAPAVRDPSGDQAGNRRKVFTARRCTPRRVRSRRQSLSPLSHAHRAGRSGRPFHLFLSAVPVCAEF